VPIKTRFDEKAQLKLNAPQVGTIPELNEPAKSGKLSCQGRIWMKIAQYQPVKPRKSQQERKMPSRYERLQAPSPQCCCTPNPEAGSTCVAPPPTSSRDMEKNNQSKIKNLKQEGISQKENNKKYLTHSFIPSCREATCSALGSNSPTDPRPVSVVSSLFREKEKKKNENQN